MLIREDFFSCSTSRLFEKYQRVRRFTETLCEPLNTEDTVVQSMPDASPAKWHLAHTSWFFETFVLMASEPSYTPFHPGFGFLFNSYYNSAGSRHPRPLRGLLTRPALGEIYAYRGHVDKAMLSFFESRGTAMEAKTAQAIELGLHHEQQHQELILTDIKHLFSLNPLYPAYRETAPCGGEVPEMEWIPFPESLVWVGHDGKGFGYDNEFPRHQVKLGRFEIASRPVTNGEYLGFMKDGGYERPELWLSDGWDAVKREGWKAPLYWLGDGKLVFTLSGVRELNPAEPVCHVSYYEADAYARWAGARLLLESEWEEAAGSEPVDGNTVESGLLHPCPPAVRKDGRFLQIYGDVWEWTGSPYMPYPGYRPSEGAFGEYNGKFMCNQMVLRGGSCATSRTHLRPSYRNFFYPSARWQFSGIRLARDVIQ